MDLNLIEKIILGSIIIISEILPFFPKKYIKSHGILHFGWNLIKKIVKKNKYESLP